MMLHSSHFMSLLLLGKLGTRQLLQTSANSFQLAWQGRYVRIMGVDHPHIMMRRLSVFPVTRQTRH